MTQAIDIRKIRKESGLIMYEMSVLLGASHTAQSKIENRNKHDNGNTALYWVLQNLGHQVVNTLLDRWLDSKPKNKEYARVLMQIARRYKGREFNNWCERFRRSHAEFF